MWSYRRWLKRLKRKRRAITVTAGAIMVVALITTAVTMGIGALVFTKTWSQLNSLRDTTFSTQANASIAGLNVDFFSGIDLLRVILYVMPAGIVISAVMAYFVLRRD